MTTLNRRYIFFLAILFVIVGIFFRFYQLNFESYWWDEILGFWVADPNISFYETYSRRALTDQNPLLFHLILKNYFNLFGYNPELGRYVSFFFGILSIPSLGILSYQIKSNNSYLLAILLISLNIYLIKYSQEVRPYSLVFLLSIINLIFYYRIISLDRTYFFKKIYIFFLYIIFSVLTFLSHPFTLIIFFSQITYSVYSFFIFKNKNYLFFFSIPIILIIYLLLSYDYLFLELAAKKNHFIINVDWKFMYNFFFSRFFGSIIMGLIYLITLIFLITYFRKKIFLVSNNYLLLVFVLLFSYLIPFVYGLFFVPILFDRYIIFVLIPILILISILIFEINKKSIRNILLAFILIPTFANHYLEIKLRDNTKPQFNKLFNYLNKQETKNLTLIVNSNIDSLLIDILENYIRSSNVVKKNDFKIFDIYNLPPQLKKIWTICYKSITLNCNIPIDESKDWILVKDQKLNFLNAKLFKIEN